MGKIKVITVLSVFTLAATTVVALDFGVGASYAPARVVGYVDETR
jgi:hypothetical protein